MPARPHRYAWRINGRCWEHCDGRGQTGYGKPVTVGDADYESCREVAGWVTPVPGGVGPVTVAILMRNTLIAMRRQKEHYEGEFAAGGMPA